MSTKTDLPVPATPAAIRGVIETYRIEMGIPLMEAILLYAERFGVEVEAMASVVQGNMKTELEIEARSAHLLKPVIDDSRGSSKSSPSH